MKNLKQVASKAIDKAMSIKSKTDKIMTKMVKKEFGLSGAKKTSNKSFDMVDVKFLYNKKNKDLFAYFYSSKADRSGMKECYSHIGQHSTCASSYATDSVLATKKQYDSLYKELENLGYNLNVYNADSKKSLSKAKETKSKVDWDFIEANLNNYYSDDRVLWSDILSRYIGGEPVDKEDVAYIKENFDNPKAELKRIDTLLMKEAIEDSKRKKGLSGSVAKGTNKWNEVFVVQGNYGSRWEDLTTEDTLKEGKARLKEYRANDKAPTRLISRKVLNTKKALGFLPPMSNTTKVVGALAVLGVGFLAYKKITDKSE